MVIKKWYASKTIWANVMALVTAAGAVAQGAMTWQEALFPAMLAVVNTILRMVTKQAID